MGCQYFEPCEQGAGSFTVAMPKLTFGRGCLSEVGARAEMRGFKRAAIFTDPFLVGSSYLKTVTESLSSHSIDFDIFSEIRIEPDDKTIVNAARFLDEGNFDGVISVGGGSSIDTAKGALVYHAYPADFTDYFAPPVGAGLPIPGPVLPHIACPTTSGTGSECTSVSVIRLTEHNCKFVIGSPHLVPVDAIVDPACTDTLHANVIASTGFDLLCHAIECYTAKSYTKWDAIADPARRPLLQGANPWSDLAAREALNIAGCYLERGVKDNQDTKARDQLMWGATLAGMAFGNSGTHLPHAMSYGVTHLMNNIETAGYKVSSPFIPHGISVVVSAPAIFEFLAEGAPERHLEAAEYLGMDIKDADLQDAGEVVSKRIIQLMRGTGMPNGLGEIGFGGQDVNAMAESAIRQGRAIQNAPRVAERPDLKSIYSSALSYW
ncbi:MAG: hydroxyacid-oxoacid transhydrogenase [Parasphingorhabdus sp.]|jgi:hydroxyacid-oxoacid transhydrogenase